MKRPHQPLIAAIALAVLMLAIGLGAGTARAQTSAPPNVLAFYRLQPGSPTPTASWLTQSVQLLQAAGVVPPDNIAAADGVLIASLLGNHPHTVALLDLQADRYVPREVAIGRMQLVLVIDAPGRFAQFRQVLQTILSHYGQPEQRRQSTIELPGDRTAVRYRLADWPHWLCLEWYADDQRFYLGVGTDSLKRWFAPAELGAPSDHRPQRHSQAVGNTGKMTLELFADLAGLKQSIPTLFQTGRTTPLLQLFGVGNVDEVMLHGRWVNSFLVLDLTTSVGDRIQRTPLTLDHWPADAGVPQPPGSIHVVAPVDWVTLYHRIMRTIWLAHEPEYRPANEASIAGFIQQAGVDPAEYLHRFRGYLLATDYPPPWLAIPGAVTTYFVLRNDEDAQAAHRDLGALMGPLLKPIVVPADDRNLGVAHDQATDLYYLDSPLRQIFKSPAWGWSAAGPANYVQTAGPVLIASYSPQAVLVNRQWLSAP